jgi:hypothetical protein
MRQLGHRQLLRLIIAAIDAPDQCKQPGFMKAFYTHQFVK